MATVHTGTMGWSYPDWRGPFYTTGTSESRFLAEYAQVFDAIELDTTFYAAPRAKTLTQWAHQTPDPFFFSAKAPRSITHDWRLIGPLVAAEARAFGELLQSGLGTKLGRLVLQLPPDFSPKEQRNLLTFADALADSDQPWTVELRDGGWVETSIATQLAERGFSVATTDRVALPGAPLTYLRLLGEENAVERFDQRVIDRSTELRQWGEKLKEADGTIFVHVRNFYEGHAPGTLRFLREALGLPTPPFPGEKQLSLF